LIVRVKKKKTEHDCRDVNADRTASWGVRKFLGENTRVWENTTKTLCGKLEKRLRTGGTR